jgi:hypothetical protein
MFNPQRNESYSEWWATLCFELTLRDSYISSVSSIRAFQHWEDTKAGWKPALQNEVILCAVAQASCLQF